MRRCDSSFALSTYAKATVLTGSDRLFWCALAKVWSGWRGALMFVQPETVVRWQRERFRRFWARLSKPKRIKRGRPCIPADIRRLIVQMAVENPLWRAPRIHRELKMLGIVVSERTVSRICALFPDRRPRAGRHSSTTMSVRSCQRTSLPYRRSRSKCYTSLSCSLIAAARSCTLM